MRHVPQRNIVRFHKINIQQHKSFISFNHLLKTNHLFPSSNIVPQDSNLVAKQHRLANRLQHTYLYKRSVMRSQVCDFKTAVSQPGIKDRNYPFCNAHVMAWRGFLNFFQNVFFYFFFPIGFCKVFTFPFQGLSRLHTRRAESPSIATRYINKHGTRPKTLIFRSVVFFLPCRRKKHNTSEDRIQEAHWV